MRSSFVFWREGRGRAAVLPEKRRGTCGVLAHVPSGADSRPGEDAATLGKIRQPSARSMTPFLTT